MDRQGSRKFTLGMAVGVAVGIILYRILFAA